MRAKSTRIILLTDFPEVENPGGIISPASPTVIRRATSSRTMLWDMRDEEFPDGENICDSNITHTTYTGSGNWCGYFGNILNEHGYNNRFLNLTMNGTVTGENWMGFGTVPMASFPPWTLECSGGAAVDPSDNCSEANNLLIEQHTNGAPIPMSGWGWNWSTVGIDIVDTTIPDPEILNRTTIYGHPVSGDFPEDGVNTPFGVSRMTPGNIAIINDTVKHFYIEEGWFGGAFAGYWNSYGTVVVTLSNEQTLYDQLLLDGASVAPTRGSRIVSLDNESGAYEATVSAVTFTIPDALNVNGVEYVVMFRVRRTPDVGEPVLMEIWHYYTGNGNAGETMTVQLPPAINSITEFVGECVSLIPASDLGDYDNFERLTDGAWAHDVGAWQGWDAPMRFICGGTISYDSFERIASDPDVALALTDEVDSGHCWADNWRFLNKNDISWDDMEGKVDGETVGIWIGGIGWGANGIFYEVPQERAFDNFESYAVGDITEWENGTNWGSVGEFIADGQSLAEDDFDAYADGAITVLDNGDGWGSDGYFIP